jgi:hypothetical protein
MGRQAEDPGDNFTPRSEIKKTGPRIFRVFFYFLTATPGSMAWLVVSGDLLTREEIKASPLAFNNS